VCSIWSEFKNLPLSKARRSKVQISLGIVKNAYTTSHCPSRLLVCDSKELAAANLLVLMFQHTYKTGDLVSCSKK